MKFLESETAPLGLGCWPIGGAMYAADGQSLGYTQSDDAESVRAIHAALANGITLFDTAAAYGAGHSERLLAKALKNRPDALVVTKIGIAIDEKSRTLLGEDRDPANVKTAIDACLTRLDRDVIDLLLLHPNETPIDAAAMLFSEMEKAMQQGKVRAFGWSTDFIANVDATKHLEGFKAVEHAMHVLMDAPDMQRLTKEQNLHALIRSPLAMGLLSGKYDINTSIPNGDVRATNQGWVQYYIDGKPNPAYMQLFDAIRELLQSNGRTVVQGALSWLWGKSDHNIPIPGARTVEQVEGLAKALSFGPLPSQIVSEIEGLVGTEFVSHGDSSR